MMIVGPLGVALIPGILIVSLAWWFSKKDYPRLLKMLPGGLGIISALILFYIGFVHIRGFEGAAYGLLSFFLILFACISFLMGQKRNHTR
ncbi:YesK family protein [Peribacillus sp. NPDC046944]|uniref:YesK family protein n=2 Tax=Peribacillus TaxID=2675229 RepID=UPI003D05E727